MWRGNLWEVFVEKTGLEASSGMRKLRRELGKGTCRRPGKVPAPKKERGSVNHAEKATANKVAARVKVEAIDVLYGRS